MPGFWEELYELRKREQQEAAKSNKYAETVRGSTHALGSISETATAIRNRYETACGPIRGLEPMSATEAPRPSDSSILRGMDALSNTLAEYAELRKMLERRLQSVLVPGTEKIECCEKDASRHRPPSDLGQTLSAKASIVERGNSELLELIERIDL